MKQLIIAVDPGQTGAISVMQGSKIAALYDMPTSARLHGKGQQVDGYTLSTLLLEHTGGHDIQVLIEAVSAMPGNGASSMFRFGESVGVVLGVCGALQLPVQWIRPTVWKKAAGLVGKAKDAA